MLSGIETPWSRIGESWYSCSAGAVETGVEGMSSRESGFPFTVATRWRQGTVHARFALRRSMENDTLPWRGTQQAHHNLHEYNVHVSFQRQNLAWVAGGIRASTFRSSMTYSGLAACHDTARNRRGRNERNRSPT